MLASRMTSTRRKKTSRPRTKLSVSFQTEHEAWLRARAKREDRPFSTVLADAVQDAKMLEARREFLAWLEKGQDRPITAEDLEEVAREWRGARRARRSA